MWGDKTKYFLFSFLVGIIVSKINFYLFEHNPIGCHSVLHIANTALLPLLLLSSIGYFMYNKQYDCVIYMAGILFFCLGYNNHHYNNPYRITIESEVIEDAKRLCIEMCNIIPPKYSCYVKALLFGDRSGISYAEKDLFIKTGTLHLFALSGLHAGIVYSMIYYILFPIRLIQFKWVHPTICCTVLMLYAIISGSSSSVMRATVMITIYNISRRVLIKSSRSNTLLVTAFILSLYAPDSIFEVGFQLSFAAMIGILYLYPYIKNCVCRFSTPKPIRYLLNLSSMTLSCQIATFPISLFYFGSISPIFMLGNLVAIPLVTLIIYVSICTLLLHQQPILFFCLEWALRALFELLFYIINLLGN